MGRLQDQITSLVEHNLFDRGMDSGKVAKRLIEAGIRMLAEEGKLTDEHRIRVSDFDTGEFHITTFTPGPAAVAVRSDVLLEAGSTFDTYARHHYAKTPPDIEKAERNVEMAGKCFEAAGESYSPPPKPSAMPDFRPVESDSAPAGSESASGSARALLKALHAAEIEEKPMLGVHVHLDDQPVLAALVELGYLNRDDVSDKVAITTKGKDAIGVRPDGVPDLPVEVAEITGNIEERELSARYIDGKIKGVEKWIAENPGDANKHDYEIMARILIETAHEFRIGLHLPTIHVAGRVIPYNEDRSTGVAHASGLRSFFEDVYARNLKAGWWTDIETGEPKKRSVGELFILFVTEIAEAYMAYRNDQADDKLPQYPGLGVELADLGIRWADFCGAYLAGNIVEHSGARNPGDEMFIEILEIAQRYEAIRKTPEAKGEPEEGNHIPAADVAVMVDAKLDFNAKREDHKIENRLKEDGKRT